MKEYLYTVIYKIGAIEIFGGTFSLTRKYVFDSVDQYLVNRNKFQPLFSTIMVVI